MKLVYLLLLLLIYFIKCDCEIINNNDISLIDENNNNPAYPNTQYITKRRKKNIKKELNKIKKDEKKLQQMMKRKRQINKIRQSRCTRKRQQQLQSKYNHHLANLYNIAKKKSIHNYAAVKKYKNIAIHHIKKCDEKKLKLTVNNFKKYVTVTKKKQQAKINKVPANKAKCVKNLSNKYKLILRMLRGKPDTLQSYGWFYNRELSFSYNERKNWDAWMKQARRGVLSCKEKNVKDAIKRMRNTIASKGNNFQARNAQNGIIADQYARPTYDTMKTMNTVMVDALGYTPFAATPAYKALQRANAAAWSYGDSMLACDSSKSWGSCQRSSLIRATLSAALQALKQFITGKAGTIGEKLQGKFQKVGQGDFTKMMLNSKTFEAIINVAVDAVENTFKYLISVQNWSASKRPEIMKKACITFFISGTISFMNQLLTLKPVTWKWTKTSVPMFRKLLSGKDGNSPFYKVLKAIGKKNGNIFPPGVSPVKFQQMLLLNLSKARMSFIQLPFKYLTEMGLQPMFEKFVNKKAGIK